MTSIAKCVSMTALTTVLLLVAWGCSWAAEIAAEKSGREAFYGAVAGMFTAMGALAAGITLRQVVEALMKEKS